VTRGMARRTSYLVSVVIALSMIDITSGAAQTNRALPDGQLVSGTLSFDGHATVGDFVGTTSTVSGQISGAPDLERVQGWVEAPVRSLKTGDGKRDKDLNKSMESDKYPTIRFNLDSITRVREMSDSLQVLLHGSLMLHGVSRRVDLPAAIRLGESTARMRSDFPVNLKDYRIGGLSKLLGMLRMYEDIEVHADLLFRFDS
jgi:polyisoprenoid-binding protein YceI